jgi:hypothetical protein
MAGDGQQGASRNYGRNQDGDQNLALAVSGPEPGGGGSCLQGKLWHVVGLFVIVLVGFRLRETAEYGREVLDNSLF